MENGFLKSDFFGFLEMNFWGVVSGVDVFGGLSYDVLESFIIFYRTDPEIAGVGVWKFGC